MTSGARLPGESPIMRDPQRAAAARAGEPAGAWKFAVTLGAAELKLMDAGAMLLDVIMILPGARYHTRQLSLVLSELLSNALDHGLLGLDANFKGRPGGLEQYLKTKAQALDQLEHGAIEIALELDPAGPQPVLRITMRDSGAGFDHRACRSQVPPRGRGMALIDALCVDVEYRGSGNEVSVSYLLRSPGTERLRRVA